MSRRKLSAICLALILGAGALAEAVVRVRAYARFGAYTDIYDLFERCPGVDILRPIPNLSARYADQAQIDISSLGFRSPELANPKPAGTLRLAYLGASTTFCANASTNGASWPSLCSALVDQALGNVTVDYLNAGVTGYDVADSILAVEHRLQPCSPDVLIIYHAANDLANNSWAVAHAAGLVEASDESWLEDVSLLWMLVQKNRRYFAAQDTGRSSAGKLDFDPKALSSGFRRDLTELVHQGQQLSDVVVLVTFATKVRAEQPSDVAYENMAQAFTFMSYLTPNDMLAGYAEYNRVIREVAQATGALLVPGEFDIPGDELHFADSVHFTEQGCARMAERVAEALLNSAQFNALAAKRSRETL